MRFAAGRSVKSDRDGREPAQRLRPIRCELLLLGA